MDEKINNVKSRTEQANLMGIKTSKDIDWGNYSSKTCGSVGGATKESPTKDESSILK
ncbi:small, acid-soluble spore protein, alpha/beta type [Clostridium psychrophilum]|uniref:small, acid-soluble spore protein, alpha/beta type n=1 Tax=Clostridium psychrophilum TaxID=132926 RepID=UPI001C0D4320|nr:small, acid-soluble spore protein, alpha/beta type [Clostridium psychrophilum]MBU3181412.1 alpha/beta-type small acid-soluble spore protein [Clostridium psychrophilum]